MSCKVGKNDDLWLMIDKRSSEFLRDEMKFSEVKEVTKEIFRSKKVNF